MKIAIGCDHAGFPFKDTIIQHLQNQGIEVLNFGANSSASADYPDFAHPTGQSVETGQSELGILICGSGNGVAMTANKHQHVRAAICWNEELATLARSHNNANIIAIPARFITLEMALKLVDIFLKTPFEGGRHERRVEKIACS